MKNRDVVQQYNAVMVSLKIKKNGFECNKVLNKIKRILNDGVEEIQEHQRLMQEEVAELQAYYAKKDKDDKPVIVKIPTGEFDKEGNPVTVDGYAGLNRGLNPEYDEKIKHLNRLNREYLDEESRIDFESVGKYPMSVFKNLFANEEFDGLLQGYLEPFVMDEK